MRYIIVAAGAGWEIVSLPVPKLKPGHQPHTAKGFKIKFNKY